MSNQITTKAKSKPRAERLADAVCMMAEAFGQKITPALIQAYLIGTQDLSIEAVETACATAVIGSKWFPKVFELRQIAGASAGTIEVADRAILNWAAVRRAIISVGSYETVWFDDPIVTATIRSLGGWPHLCNTPSGERLDVWMQKEFCALYAILSGQGIDAAQAAPLPGLNGSEGGFAIRGEPVKVCIGLPPIDRKLVRGLIQEPLKIVAQSEPVREFVKSLDLPEEMIPRRAPVEEIPREDILAELEAVAGVPGHLPMIRHPKQRPFIRNKGDDSGET